MEPICEMTQYPELYKNTNWGIKTWVEVEPKWSDALDLIDNRDAFARSWDLDFVQPLNWDGDFHHVKRIECYRPYKSFGIAPYLGVIHIETNRVRENFPFQDFELIPWAGPLYSKQYSTFCIIKDTEQDLYQTIKTLDGYFTPIGPELEIMGEEDA